MHFTIKTQTECQKEINEHFEWTQIEDANLGFKFIVQMTINTPMGLFTVNLSGGASAICVPFLLLFHSIDIYGNSHLVQNEL